MTEVEVVPTIEASTLAADADAWDAFVAGAPTGSYMQLTAWAEVKASNGWRRIVAVSKSLIG